jgi:hypothetical protein
MGIKFGEIDSNQIIENEFRIGVLERSVEFLAANRRLPNQQELDQIRKDVSRDLKSKYPNSIKLPEE